MHKETFNLSIIIIQNRIMNAYEWNPFWSCILILIHQCFHEIMEIGDIPDENENMYAKDSSTY